MDIIKKRPQRDLNPCYRRERAVSWAGLDDRDLNLPPPEADPPIFRADKFHTSISQSKKNQPEVNQNFAGSFVLE